ncbi:MAG: DUF1302 family protein [Pseudomonadota bacterium]
MRGGFGGRTCYAWGILLACALFIAPAAHAIIIGEIVVKSKIGKPLLAYIPISREIEDEKITPACLSLLKSGDSSNPDRQYLSSAKMVLEGSAKKNNRQIWIFTTEPVNSRLLALRIKANCVPLGLQIREFEFTLEAEKSPAALQPAESPPVPAAVPAPVAEEESGIRKKLDLNGSVRAGYFSSSRKLDDEKNLGTGSLWLKASPELGAGVSVVVEGWIRNDQSLGSGANVSRLREGYTDFSLGNTDFRIGKQIIVWGRADRLNPTDNLSPRNYTLLTAEDDDQRLGAPAAKATYHLQEFALTAIWLTGFTPNVLPIAAQPNVQFTERRPAAPQGALRLDHTGGAVDWSVSYFNGLDLNPDIAIRGIGPAGLNLELEHNRIRVLGMDAATVAGRYGLRAEAAYSWTANTGENDYTVKKPFLYAVAGGDRTFFDYLNINIQYYFRLISNYQDPREIANPVQRPVAVQGAVLSGQLNHFSHGLSLHIGNKWLNETLEGDIAAVASFTDRDYALRPKLVYAFSDHTRGTIGADLYRGGSYTFWGQLRNNSLLFTEVKYSF